MSPDSCESASSRHSCAVLPQPATLGTRCRHNSDQLDTSLHNQREHYPPQFQLSMYRQVCTHSSVDMHPHFSGHLSIQSCNVLCGPALSNSLIGSVVIYAVVVAIFAIWVTGRVKAKHSVTIYIIQLTLCWIVWKV